MASLAEQLAQLSNPAPIYEDPEDDIENETRARLVDRGNDEEFIPESSNLRKKVAPLLEDSDKRYSGKKTSRSKLMGDVEDDEKGESSEESSAESAELTDMLTDQLEGGSEDDEEVSDEDDDDDEDGLSDFRAQMKKKEKSGEDKEFSFKDDGDFSKYADDFDDDDDDVEGGSEEDSGDDDESDDDDEDVSGSEDDMVEDDESDEGGIQKFSKSSLSEEIEKGESVKSQLSLLDNFLECRIKLQKSLALINQLPQKSEWKKFEQEGGEEFQQSAKQGNTLMKTLLDQLYSLQSLLLHQFPETKHIIDGGKAKASVDDDEEIPSDTDPEEEDDDKVKIGIKRKHKTTEYPELLTKRHKDFKTFRNTTIQKWNDKTKLASGKMSSKSFTAFDQSALKQIEQILSDRTRLVKRTQLKRSAYRVLGKEEVDRPVDTKEEEEQTTLPNRDHLKDYDEEIFDDDDFYHQLLREFIERKSSESTDPVALGRQWLEIQKLRRKVKKNVDTRASKGRKIRYDVLSKLVNFMPSIDNSSWTEEAKNELFSSLFGKRFQGEVPPVQEDQSTPR